MLPTIVAFYVQSFVCVPSLSSPLLLRNYPNFFDYYGSSPMCLSSRNRSNFKAFRHIMPCIAPVCDGMHYHKTGVPWQMNKTLIIFSPILKIFTIHNLHIQITYFQYFAQNVLNCYQTHNLQSLCDILHLYILLQI